MAEPTTVIGERTSVRGNLQGDEDLTVLGRVEGTIELERTLTIEQTGVVKADVTVRHAIISGVMVGNVTASESVHLTSEGRMVGDISSPRVILVEGAMFRGRVDMGEAAPGAPVARPAAPARPARSAPPRPAAPARAARPAPEPAPEVQEPDRAPRPPARPAPIQVPAPRTAPPREPPPPRRTRTAPPRSAPEPEEPRRAAGPPPPKPRVAAKKRQVAVRKKR